MSNKKGLIIYFSITLFCGVFSFIYEYYSHGVYSNYIIYLFAIPFLLGILPILLIWRYKTLSRGISDWQKIIHRFSIVTLIAGFMLAGILEIYGTSSDSVKWYFIAGITMLLASTGMWLKKFIQTKKTLN